jgi:hypothetical protein
MKLIDEIKKNSGLIVEGFLEHGDIIAMKAAKKFFEKGRLDYDPDRDVKFLSKIIYDEMSSGKSIEDIATKASKRYWKKCPHDYDPDRDVKFLSKIISDEIKKEKD